MRACAINLASSRRGGTIHLREMDLSRSKSRIVKSAAKGLRRRTQTSQILRIKSTQRAFDSVANADNSFFYARTQKRDPKLSPI